ncbi:MAG TPA: hypothetical protein VJ777_18450 [Mycobacterium sp.]|nr:hypothetical protein [Mycobacterium sp.]
MTAPAGDQQQSGDGQPSGQAQGGSQQQAPTPGQTQSGKQGGDAQQDDLDSPKFSQRHYNNFEANLRREYAQKRAADEALINKGKQLEQQEQEQQPLSERVSTLSTEKAALDSQLSSTRLEKMRLEMAYDAGLPPALGRRVQGNTREEIEADIEALKQAGFGGTQQQGAGGQQQGSGVKPNQQQGMPSADNQRTGSVSSGRDLFKDRHGKKEAAVGGSN